MASPNLPPVDAPREIYSGHESFPFRYGWLPKLYDAVTEDAALFSDDDAAIARLGIGKNMVRSLRFWGDALGLIEADGRLVRLTPFAHSIFDPTQGRDRYLERTDTLWRLHWRLTTHTRLGAWQVAFAELSESEVTRRHLLSMVRQRAARTRGEVSTNTLQTHVSVLLQTYAGPEEGETVLEDTLGCPLQELRLLRVGDAGGEPTVRIERGAKAGLEVGAFAEALVDRWRRAAPGSQVVSLRSLLLDRGGPGRVFKLDEAALHERVLTVCRSVSGLEIREDGVGRLDLVATRKSALRELEQVAA
ncbi:DUF4007 family protein [Methylobacterium sp. NPDC080182]|uniref:DUF4007 family protein n=1 Tax=Methylobacterium sp. NPDC080182 TaxID=3390590 RepID=UPI003D07B122